MDTQTQPPPNQDTYSAIQTRSGTTHALLGIGGVYEPTFCGILPYYLVDAEYRECATGEPITCKRCRRSLAASSLDKAARTLAIGGEA